MVKSIRIYSYVNKDNYSFLKGLRDRIKNDGYSNISISKLIKLGIKELENTDYTVIMEKLVKYGMI